MSRRWQLQEAKNRFSEVVDLAIAEGPQLVTRHGKNAVVIVAKAEFDRRRRGAGRKGTLLPFLRKLGFAGAALRVDRSKDRDRALEI